MKKFGKTKTGRFLCALLAAALIATGLPLPEGFFEGAAVQTVSAAEESEAETPETQEPETPAAEKPIIIRFKDDTGRRYYRDLQMTAKMGDRITLPVLKGYQWKLDNLFKFKGNAKVTLSAEEDWSDYITNGVLTFQAEKIFYVSFYNTNGTQNRTLKKMQKMVIKGNKMRLPAVPEVNGYVNLGWSTRKNARTANFPARKVITVKRNLKLYAVRKKVEMKTVTFSNNKGTSTASAYRKLGQKVIVNKAFTLPEVPKRKGYSGVGWTTVKGGKTAEHAAGEAVTITGNTRYYAVYKRSTYYKVSFFMSNGRSDAAYRKLTANIEADTEMIMPSIPAKEGYVGIGWSLKRNSASGMTKVGSKCKITKDMKFYAVQESAVTVTLCKNDGTVYRDLKVGKGNYLVLPAVANAKGETFMGWSRTAGKKAAPEFEAGGRVRVNANVKLYAAVFDRSKEQDLQEADMALVDLWKLKYKQVIFVGDSRTVKTQLVLNRQFGADSTVTWNTEFISQIGVGLEWLKRDGSEQLLNMVKKNNKVQKPTAVIFNLGVNDLSNLSNYISYMNELAPALKEKNCKLFYMSVNPGNSKMMENTGHEVRGEETIRAFNRSISKLLADNYTFIDTYSWLMNTGYGTDVGANGADRNVDDGLHYTAKTYKRIFYHCLEFLLSQPIPK